MGGEALAFPRTWVGFPSEQTLEILSRSRAPLSLPVAVAPPFFVDRGVVELGGGDAARLVVRFSPEVEGVFHEVLTVGDLEVRLDGVAAVPPACRTTTPCRSSAFDPVSGACLTRPLADGAACATDGCIDDGRCLEGECLGATRSCDDDNACTRDWCAPGVGCQHADSSADCEAAIDPCLAPACDPRTGCTVVPVADGTPCGAVSCVLADVCLQGRCVAVTPPDGFQCAAPTPCQDPGVCQAQVCVPGAVRELTPRWTFQPPGDTALAFDGVVDTQGNFWWVECFSGEQMSCHAVSVTKDGFRRFVGNEVTGMAIPEVSQLFDEGRFVFATANGVVVAVDGTTGVEQWRVPLTALAADAGIAVGGGLVELSSDGQGHLWASAPDDGWCFAGTPGWVAQLDAVTGALRFTAAFSSAGPLVGDEHGNVYAADVNSPMLLSWSPQASVRFGVTVDGGAAPVAAGQGRVVMSSNRSFATGNGVELPPWGARDLIADAALQVGGQTIRLQRELRGPLPPVMPGVSLSLFDATTPAGRTLAQVAGPGGEVTLPVLAQGDVVLVTGRFGPSPAVLQAVTTAGATRFRCAVSEPATGGLETFVGPKVGFSGDRLALLYYPQCPYCLRAPDPILRVFDTTGLGVPTSGWVAPRGTPGNAGHAR